MIAEQEKDILLDKLRWIAFDLSTAKHRLERYDITAAFNILCKLADDVSYAKDLARAKLPETKNEITP